MKNFKIYLFFFLLCKMDQSKDLIDKFNLKLAKSIQLNKPIDLLAFEHALRIYVNKPQVINKWVNI
jgi:hypothetical protein